MMESVVGIVLTIMQRSSQIAQARSLVLPSQLIKSDVKRSVLNARGSASANDRAV